MAAPATEHQRFGKYQIVERIAAGGMAEIFKARLDGIGGFHRTFAIKRILPHLTANPEFVDMLVDEAKVAGLLSHANIVQILDLGSIDQQYYIAMEFVNGRDLGQILARCADKGITLPVPHAVYVLLEMLKGLEYAHNRQVMRGGRPAPLNIVHRDISPANVLLSFQGEVKLTDFGIAKASVKALETMSGVVKGRFDYMSPEQASGGAIDQRSDLFSAGVVLYEVLTGRHPFRQPSEIATIEAIRRGTYEPPSYVNPDVPYALDLVVEQALKTNPGERFANATAFKDALDRFFHDAGFIFSASTLAAFLKGLFPETETRPAAPAPAPPRTNGRIAPRAGDDLVLEDDSSTGRGRSSATTNTVPIIGADATMGDASSLLKGLPDAGQSGAFGPVAGLADESTLIRPAPGVDPREWSEAATALRADPTRVSHPDLGSVPRTTQRQTIVPPPNLAAAVAATSPTAPAPKRPSEVGTERFPSVTAIPGPRPAPPPPAPAPLPEIRSDVRARVISRTPPLVHVLYLGLCLLAALGGLGIGLFAGNATARRPASEPVVVKLDPVVEVRYAAGASATIDGRPLAGPSPSAATLTANKPALIEVKNPGGGTTSTRLTLDYNQMRVLDLTPVGEKKDP